MTACEARWQVLTGALQLRRLHTRTGIEVAVIGVKSDRTQYTQAMTFGTSPRVQDFFQLSLGTTMDDISASFEAYCVSGVSGTCSTPVSCMYCLLTRLRRSR